MMTPPERPYLAVKRALDVALSSAALVALSPVMAACAVAIKAEDPAGPVLFNQERLGRHGRVFLMHKFRTMRVGAEHTGSGVYSEKGDPRVTRVGRVLRATSLDELPQLANVIKGEMSLVGFRPPLTYHPWPWEQYTPEQRRMFDLRPGITGWAQVNGRRTVAWPDRIALNVWYAEHVSLALDAKIVLMTVAKVLGQADNLNVGATVAPAPAEAPAWSPAEALAT